MRRRLQNLHAVVDKGAPKRCDPETARNSGLHAHEAGHGAGRRPILSRRIERSEHQLTIGARRPQKNERQRPI